MSTQQEDWPAFRMHVFGDVRGGFCEHYVAAVREARSTKRKAAPMVFRLADDCLCFDKSLSHGDAAASATAPSKFPEESHG
jgi:hypothetical protein